MPQKKENTPKTTQQSIRIQEQNNKYLNIIWKHSVKTLELPKRANWDINWSEVNWFEKIILPKDYEIYKHIVKELVDNWEIPPASELKPKTRLLRDRETMNYYEIPEDIQELVEQKKYDEIPVFAKIKKIKNEKNKIQTQNKWFSTLEINENPTSQLTSSPWNTSKKEQNSKTSWEWQQGNKLPDKYVTKFLSLTNKIVTEFKKSWFSDSSITPNFVMWRLDLMDNDIWKKFWKIEWDNYTFSRVWLVKGIVFDIYITTYIYKIDSEDSRKKLIKISDYIIDNYKDINKLSLLEVKNFRKKCLI